MKFAVVKLYLLAICLIRMLEFSVNNAVAFFVSFWQRMQTLMSETWQLMSKVLWTSSEIFQQEKPSLEFWVELQMIVQSMQDYSSSSQPSWFGACEMQLQTYQGL